MQRIFNGFFAHVTRGWIWPIIQVTLLTLVVACDSNVDSSSVFPNSVVPVVSEPKFNDVPSEGKDSLTPEEEIAFEAQATNILAQNCVVCHQLPDLNRPGMAFMSNGVTSQALQARNYIVPGKPYLSYLYQRMASKSMPPDQPLSGDQIDVIRKWIEFLPISKAGKGQERVSVNDDVLVKDVETDLDGLSLTDLPFTRYLSLANLYNRTDISDQELEIHRQALTKLINSLSWNPNIIQLKTVKDPKILYRLDTRVFLIPTAWDQSMATYPYNLSVTDVQRFQNVKDRLGTQVPIVRADWFLFTASQPPLYHTLLDIPASEQELETRLAFNSTTNIRNVNVLRSGFANSGVANYNRVIERHNTSFGAYWKSYDFSSETGRQDILLNPLGPSIVYEPDLTQIVGNRTFQHAGGEVIFHLPNRMQAYLLVNAAGKRLDQAPIEIVTDPNQPDRVVTNGVSCNTCHVTGFIHTPDNVRSLYGTDPSPADVSAAYVDLVLKLYPIESQFKTVMDQDSNQFVDALKQTGNDPANRDTIIISVDTYRDTVSSGK